MLSGVLHIFVSEMTKIWYDIPQQGADFCIKSVKLSKENKKLTRTMCVSLNYTIMKETLKKEFSDISSLEHKKVPVVKEEVERINFSCYKDDNEKKSYGEGNGVNFSCKQGRQKCCFKCNSANPFVCDCTGLRNNINTVIESDQVHFTLTQI